MDGKHIAGSVWFGIVGWVRQESAAATALVQAFIALGIAFAWWHWNNAQTGAVIGIVSALLGMFVRSQVTPLVRPRSGRNVPLAEVGPHDEALAGPPAGAHQAARQARPPEAQAGPEAGPPEGQPRPPEAPGWPPEAQARPRESRPPEGQPGHPTMPYGSPPGAPPAGPPGEPPAGPPFR